MIFRAATLGTFLLVFSLSTGVAIASPSKAPDEEGRLSSKLAREKNPVKKAKLETQLGRLKLGQAFSAYDQGHFDQCWKLFDDYLAHMNNAWAELVASGHEAAKRPEGFKQLDIALRESARDLENFETHITFEERQAAEKIHAQTADLHTRVLDALFPGGMPTRKKGSLGGKDAPGSQPRKEPR